jgi:transcriptional regulator with XRE-family HTH domain
MKTPSPRRPRLRRSRARVRYPDLASYIAATGDTQDHIAEKLGCAQAYVSRVATGRMVPRPEMALKLARYAHIPLDSFMLVYEARRRLAQEVA